MPWVRFEDDYLGSQKLSTLSTAAIALDMAGIIYAGQHLRDGHLTARDVEVVAAQIAIKQPRGILGELVRVGRWDVEADGGYGIHDYLEYQPSRAQVLAQRRADSARKRRRTPAGIPLRDRTGLRPDYGPDSVRIPSAPYPDPVKDDDAAAGAVSPRARADGGFQPLGSFLSGRRQRRQQTSEIPDEVLARLQQPPIAIDPAADIDHAHD